MILAGHQPQYLPYPGYFHKIERADLFIIVDHIQYKKKEWQNRNRIRTNEGWMWLTVPVITRGNYYQPICDVEIRANTRWQEKHWRSILLNYKKAPHFSLYASDLKTFFESEWKKLADLNLALIKHFMDLLGINTPIVVSSDYDFGKKKTELLTEMCLELGADGYLSGSGGKDYVDESLLHEAGLSHQFDDYTCPVYPQVHAKGEQADFIANLSVIDMLFNVGPAARELVTSATATD